MQNTYVSQSHSARHLPLQGSPIISIKEARKLLGSAAAHLTDGELEDMLFQQEQVLRFIFRQYIVHKQTMVK